MSPWEIAASCVASLLVGLMAGGFISARVQRARASAIYRRLSKAFQPVQLACLTVTERQFPARIRADLQRALDDYFGGRAKVLHLCGVRVEQDMFGIDLSYLLTSDATGWEVPLQHEEVNIGGDILVHCPRNALWIACEGDVRLAVLLSKVSGFNQPPQIKVNVAATNDDHGRRITQEFFARLEKAVKEAVSYRGKVLSLDTSDSYSGEGTGIKVHQIAPVTREDVILKEETLDLVERNVLQFVVHRSRLRGLGQSIRKGLLLYGPPGNGKTFTIRYVIGALEGHTTLLITGAQIAQLREYMALARLLQPSLVVIEDIDLVAKERVQSGTSCEEPLLNQLLNEMDGLAPEAEVIFLLTTNRPELLEEALANRPGRIDQAIEFSAPGNPERALLARHYAGGVKVDPTVIEYAVAATEGASAAFMKELMRRAVQLHLARRDDEAIEIVDVQEALDELVLNQRAFSARVLGFDIAAATSDQASNGAK
ncbi:MAG TPA: ATP-binding protein [Pirellulales bacterium]|jgi:AAA+ superfamily predicted ATPase